ncbi:MAG: 16S rRNA (uracil(1498)-N(3))-methyltransferase [Rhodospirillales bacterium]|nr:16S rRNA (uracil(1498)-N(3))-methyltransferase [Rhodospirillales bacterium]MCB9965618.1 16S rRNA (uracil(1498)-N(3))-methyltransferase [Rhodospirillales bacterium]MCB9973041.1 16S rRNA (uracil(1498)-N(3))-methyltransferase [Rhodospirillales bacterium]
MSRDLHKFPRLYVSSRLQVGQDIALTSDQAHYLKTVLRLEEGASVRVFNDRDGEFLLRLLPGGKKQAVGICEAQIKSPPEHVPEVHLYFAPIKKNRLDFLIEKAVELGVTQFHPVLSERTDVRKLNDERVRAQIIEAAEQCERLDLPQVHDLTPLPVAVRGAPHNIFAALEREDHLPSLKAHQIAFPAAVLIGPEGGFTPDEVNFLSAEKHVIPVSLGPRILRSETAALKMISCLSDT